jgi:coenzyme F420 hydrogenase subunit beta
VNVKIRSITDVAERQLCTGCGACAYIQPDVIRMVDDPDHGRRPVVQPDSRSTMEALGVCPGIRLEHDPDPSGTIPGLRDSWGPVLEVWEGAATDRDLRHRASSGGVSSALATFAIDRAGFHGLLHIRSRPDAPYLNETTMSTSSAAIAAAVGSRYAPASPCDRLDLIEDAPDPCVMIGKPCDVAGAVKARRMRPALDERLGLTIAMFCAGTPSLRGTLEMLTAMGVDDVTRLEELRYRGHGWPGLATAIVREPDGSRRTATLTYDESWGKILQRHRQWRCYVCADHTGEFADIAVGDPWDRPADGDEPGRSLILLRTERGRAMFDAAREAGYVDARRVEPSRLPAAQPWLEQVRGASGARIAVLRTIGVPVPVYRGLPTRQAWLRHLSMRDKLRSTLGTLRRVRRKGLMRRHPVRPLDIDGDIERAEA